MTKREYWKNKNIELKNCNMKFLNKENNKKSYVDDSNYYHTYIFIFLYDKNCCDFCGKNNNRLLPLNNFDNGYDNETTIYSDWICQKCFVGEEDD